jgi:hypothetical protein
VSSPQPVGGITRTGIAASMCRARITLIRSVVLTAVSLLAFSPYPLLPQEFGTTARGEVRTFVRSVEIGWSAIPADAIEIPPLPLARGTRYTLERVQLSEQRILRALAEEGFGNAVVEIAAEFSPDERWVDVRFWVEPGERMVFGPVLIESEPPLKEGEVLRRLTYGEGQLVSPVPLEQSVGRLQRLAIVDQVLFDARPVPGADTILVTRIVVSTTQPAGVGLEGAISSARCVQGRVGWSSRYFLGAPRTFSVSGGGANVFARQLHRFPCTGAGEEEFAAPDYFIRTELGEPVGPATWLFFSAEGSRLSEPRAYIRRGIQARVAMMHEFAPRLDALVASTPERRDNPAAGPLLCGVYNVCAADPLARFIAPARHVPIELSLGWRTAPFFGIGGALPAAPLWLQPVPRPWRFSMRGALTGAAPVLFSEFTYGTALVEGTAGRLLGTRVELAGRVRAAVLIDAGDPVPPHVRLFGGGPLGVRGVAPNLLGPKILTIPREEALALGYLPDGTAGRNVDLERVRIRPTGGETLLETSIEARVTALRWLQLAAFLDHGAVRAGADPLSPAGAGRAESVLTPGVGALVVSPFGPVRVDVAFNPEPVRDYPLLTRGEAGDQIFLGTVLYDPVRFDDPTSWRAFLRRIQLQLSMGHPF